MATSLDFARELIAAGDRDRVILGKNAPDPEIATEVLGLHCQQAVEKYIKAILATRGVEFRKVHDIKTLVDLAADAAIEVPSGDELEARTPFAVEFRYHTLPRGSSPIGRERMVALAVEVRNWADGEVLKARNRAAE